jgi:predicted anti-sigma-YlaC factor YlaD
MHERSTSVKRHPHIQSFFLPWLELTLDVQQQRLVEEHLKECSVCQKHFDAMSVVLLPSKESPPNVLLADPYLPTRIRAMAESAGRQPIGVKGIVGRWALMSVMFVMAVVFGIYIGERLSYRTSTITEQSIITEYSESLEVGGIADRLQTIAQASTEVPK